MRGEGRKGQRKSKGKWMRGERLGRREIQKQQGEIRGEMGEGMEMK